MGFWAGQKEAKSLGDLPILAESVSRAGASEGVSDQEREWGRFLLRRLLSYHPHDAEDAQMWPNKFWEFWEEYGAYVLGPALMILSLIINRFLRPYWAAHLLDDLIVALFIAGILTTTVDPFVKGRARREATRDIFHHMLGFSLPYIIRERLQEITLGTTLYREGVSQHIVLSEDGDFVVFDVEMSFDVVNPTKRALNFPALIQFEKGERPTLKSVTCFGEKNFGKNPHLTPVENGLGALEYKSEGVTIPANDRRGFKYEYTVKYPTSLGFWYPNFGTPTIGFSLTIKHPHNFRVIATNSDIASPSGEWRYPKRLWMPNEHFEIVWEKIS